MDISNLVNMANRIGDFFQSMPDRSEAKRDLATHLAKFWEPRMRAALLAQLDTPATSRLSAFVREAVGENLAQLTPHRTQ